jgi:hypothetical protein
MTLVSLYEPVERSSSSISEKVRDDAVDAVLMEESKIVIVLVELGDSPLPQRRSDDVGDSDVDVDVDDCLDRG